MERKGGKPGKHAQLGDIGWKGVAEGWVRGFWDGADRGQDDFWFERMFVERNKHQKIAYAFGLVDWAEGGDGNKKSQEKTAVGHMAACKTDLEWLWEDEDEVGLDRKDQ